MNELPHLILYSYMKMNSAMLLHLKGKGTHVKYYMSNSMVIKCEQLIRMMLQVDPDKRLSIDRIMRHKWVLQDPIEESISEVIKYYDDPVSDEPEPEREDIINETLAKIPGLEKETIQKSIHENKFDDYSAIYNLLVEKFKRSVEVSPATSASNISATGYLQPLPVVPTHHRKSSITTG
ncbi:unnamed protein product, partial [Meganyctiphanes norvegica]